MKARDDLDRGAVSDIMDSVRRKVQSEPVGAAGEDGAGAGPSIFDRMPAK